MMLGRKRDYVLVDPLPIVEFSRKEKTERDMAGYEEIEARSSSTYSSTIFVLFIQNIYLFTFTFQLPTECFPPPLLSFPSVYSSLSPSSLSPFYLFLSLHLQLLLFLFLLYLLVLSLTLFLLLFIVFLYVLLLFFLFLLLPILSILLLMKRGVSIPIQD